MSACDCYVRQLDKVTRFGLRYGAHSPTCPAYRESLDPVDRKYDDEFRARVATICPYCGLVLRRDDGPRALGGDTESRCIRGHRWHVGRDAYGALRLSEAGKRSTDREERPGSERERLAAAPDVS